MDTSYLNAAQNRAQTIKEELKRRDIDHLHSFIDGISDPEPPNYRKINGIVQPPLTMVTLKEGASNYHVGNVRFGEEDNDIQDVTLGVNTGEVEIHLNDALPEDSRNPLSVPVLDAVIVDLVPLWAEKYKAIKERVMQINDVRTFTHNCPNQPQPRLTYGKNISKLISTANNSTTTAPRSPRKRTTGEPVPRHSANKRPRIGLSSIPDSAKTQAFADLSDGFKIELYNAVTRSAVPGFDNVLMAAWNVVSVYECVGTEFAQLHGCVTELRGVLVEFEKRGGKGMAGREGETPEEVKVEEVQKVNGSPEHDMAQVAGGGSSIASSPIIKEAEESNEELKEWLTRYDKPDMEQGPQTENGDIREPEPPARDISPETLFIAEEDTSPANGQSHTEPAPHTHSQRPLSKPKKPRMNPTLGRVIGVPCLPPKPLGKKEVQASLSNLSNPDRFSKSPAEGTKRDEFMAKIRATRGELHRIRSSPGYTGKVKHITTVEEERRRRIDRGCREATEANSLAEWGLQGDGGNDGSQPGRG